MIIQNLRTSRRNDQNIVQKIVKICLNKLTKNHPKIFLKNHPKVSNKLSTLKVQELEKCQTLEAPYAPQGGQRAKKGLDHNVCGRGPFTYYVWT